MTRKCLVFGIAVCALAICLPTIAQAQATRTWVSGVGDDANPCSRTAPCKTFAGAISKTAAGGEISVLDPGGFGAVTITKAITINGDGTLAGILASLVNGIIINAGVNDRVVIRNLSINGAGNGINGIRYLAGKSVTVDNVSISGFTTRGIDAAANSRVTITNSLIANNSSNGVITSIGTSRVNVDSCQVSHNDVNGINASASGSIIRIGNNQIFNNINGIVIGVGGTVESDGTNRVAGNGATTAPNGVIPLQ